MRWRWLLLFALVACSDPDDDEDDEGDIIGPPTVPACEEYPRATFACRDAGLMLPDGTVTGIECNLDVADDSWPEGCEELSRSPDVVTYCCPW